MTRKDYELIAAAIGRTAMACTIGKKRNSEQTLRLLTSDLAATLAHENPDFDRDYFMRAGGVK